MWKLYKMKHLFIIGITILLFAGLLVANEVNKPAGKVQSVETKSLSADGIITAFTFLLAALTIMATLFGIFIGYMGYKSSKEYEKEVARAEQAANRAEMAAKQAESAVGEIRRKAEKTITGIQTEFKEAIEDIKVQAKSETKEPTERENKVQGFLEQLRLKGEAGDYEEIARMVESAIVFAEENIELWYAWARALALQRKYEDALIKVNILIGKDPKYGKAYILRGIARLAWALHDHRQPHMDQIIEDLKKATEVGFETKKGTRLFLSKHLTDAEYKEVFRHTKADDIGSE